MTQDERDLLLEIAAVVIGSHHVKTQEQNDTMIDLYELVVSAIPRSENVK